MAFVTNLTDTDLEVPSLGVHVPAGMSVEVTLEPNWVGGDSFKVTKTRPKGADVHDPTPDPAPAAVTPDEENV